MKLNRLILKLGYNTGIQIFGRGFNTVLSLLTVILLTRYLGTDGYGNFNLVFAYLSTFNITADFGLNLGVIKEFSKKKIQEDRAYGSFLSLKLILALISLALSILFLLLTPYTFEQKVAISIGTIAVLFSNLIGYTTTIFQKNSRLDLVALVDSLSRLISVVLIMLFIYWGYGLYVIVATVLVGNLGGLIVGIFLSLKFVRISFNFDKAIIKQLVKISFPIGLTLVIASLYFKIDTIILSLFKDSSDVGIYTLSYKALENILVVWSFYMASFYPEIARLEHSNKSKVDRLFRSSVMLAIISGILLLIISYTLAPLIIIILGGEDFKSSIDTFRILSMSLPFFFLSNIFYFYFIVKNKKKIVFIALCLSLLVNVILNVILVPRASYIGTSISTVITEIFLVLAYVLVLYNQIRYEKN